MSCFSNSYAGFQTITRKNNNVYFQAFTLHLRNKTRFFDKVKYKQNLKIIILVRNQNINIIPGTFIKYKALITLLPETEVRIILWKLLYIPWIKLSSKFRLVI